MIYEITRNPADLQPYVITTEKLMTGDVIDAQEPGGTAATYRVGNLIRHGEEESVFAVAREGDTGGKTSKSERAKQQHADSVIAARDDTIRKLNAERDGLLKDIKAAVAKRKSDQGKIKDLSRELERVRAGRGSSSAGGSEDADGLETRLRQSLEVVVAEQISKLQERLPALLSRAVESAAQGRDVVKTTPAQGTRTRRGDGEATPQPPPPHLKGITFARLRGRRGTWGIRSDSELNPGASVQVEKKSGGSSVETVGEFIASDRDRTGAMYWLYMIQREDKSGADRASESPRKRSSADIPPAERDENDAFHTFHVPQPLE